MLPATQLPKTENNAPVGFLMDLASFQLLRDEYIRLKDPTEYKFVKQCLGGDWERWQQIVNTEEFSPVIVRWREELATKLRSEALSRILEAAQGETRDALAANKYIYEALAKEDKKVGRPSKDAILKEAHRLNEDDRMRDEAYSRVFNNES